MPLLNEVLKQSKLSTQCKYDIERLTNEYNAAVSPSVERSRLERSRSRMSPQRQPSLCKPLTSPVPHGHYSTSPVFTQSLPRSASVSHNNSTNGFGVSKSSHQGVRLPGISRADREHVSSGTGSVAAGESSDAYRAYAEAFKSYTGRLPTSQELKAADKYTFVKDETGRDVVVDRSLSRLSNASGKSEYYYLKRHPTDSKQYPAFRKTMAPKLI